MRKYQTNTNNTVDDRQRRLDLKCSLCPPNRKENSNRKPKHGKIKKPRKPNKRQLLR